MTKEKKDAYPNVKVKFKNWPQDKRIPRGMIVKPSGWVIPDEVDAFLPSDDYLDTLQPGWDVIYLMDGTGYSLFKHEYVEA